MFRNRLLRRIAPALIAMCWVAVVASMSKGEVVLLDFGGPWCGPCRQMGPAVAQLESKGVKVSRIDPQRSDAEYKLSSDWNVDRFPTFIAVDRETGKEVGRVRGVCEVGQLWKILGNNSTGGNQAPYAPWSDARLCQVDGATGAFINLDGDKSHIVTCEHSLGEAGNTANVTLHDGRKFVGEVIGVDHENDQALIKIPVQSTAAFDVADDDAPIGTQICFAGFPARAGQATAPQLRWQSGIVQSYTDKATATGTPQYGDSGGPIISGANQLVGVVSGNPGGPLIYGRLASLKRLLRCQGSQGGRGGARPTLPSTYAQQQQPATPQPTAISPWQEKVDAELKRLADAKQDRGEYLTGDALKGYAKTGEAADDSANVGYVENRLRHMGEAVDEKLAKAGEAASAQIQKKYHEIFRDINDRMENIVSAEIKTVAATHVATTVFGLPLPAVAAAGGIAGPIGIAVAGLAWWRLSKRIKTRPSITAAGGQQSEPFRGY